jgi:hypothetical protein
LKKKRERNAEHYGLGAGNLFLTAAKKGNRRRQRGHRMPTTDSGCSAGKQKKIWGKQ